MYGRVVVGYTLKVGTRTQFFLFCEKKAFSCEKFLGVSFGFEDGDEQVGHHIHFATIDVLILNKLRHGKLH